MGLKLLPERPKANDSGICSTLESAVPGPQPKPRQVEGIAGGEVANNRRQAPRSAVMRDCPGFGIFCAFCDLCLFGNR